MSAPVVGSTTCSGAIANFSSLSTHELQITLMPEVYSQTAVITGITTPRGYHTTTSFISGTSQDITLSMATATNIQAHSLNATFLMATELTFPSGITNPVYPRRVIADRAEFTNFYTPSGICNTLMLSGTCDVDQLVTHSLVNTQLNTQTLSSVNGTATGYTKAVNHQSQQLVLSAQQVGVILTTLVLITAIVVATPLVGIAITKSTLGGNIITSSTRASVDPTPFVSSGGINESQYRIACWGLMFLLVNSVFPSDVSLYATETQLATTF